MTDTARRLRQTRASMLGTPDEQHYWDCHDAAKDIDRLRAELAARDAEVVRLKATLLLQRGMKRMWHKRYASEMAIAHGLDEQLRRSRALLTTPSAPESGWRPIETVPRDGTRVLLAYRNSLQKWRRVIAFYAPKLSIEQNDDGEGWCEYDEANDRFCLPEGWYECIDNWDEYSYVHIDENIPSHWMPIPPPPKKENE